MGLLGKLFGGNKEPKYQAKTITIDDKDANEYVIAFALAHMAGFKNHHISVGELVIDGCDKEVAAVVYHEKDIRKYPKDYPAHTDPAIEVKSRPNGQYIIMFKSDKVCSDLVDKINEELNSRKK